MHVVHYNLIMCSIEIFGAPFAVTLEYNKCIVCNKSEASSNPPHPQVVSWLHLLLEGRLLTTSKLVQEKMKPFVPISKCEVLVPVKVGFGKNTHIGFIYFVLL